MAEKRITITLIDGTKRSRWFRKIVSVMLAVCAPIAVGAYLDSSAMQWVGFIFGMVVIVGLASSESKRNTFDNVDAAKRRLDQFVAE